MCGQYKTKIVTILKSGLKSRCLGQQENGGELDITRV